MEHNKSFYILYSNTPGGQNHLLHQIKIYIVALVPRSLFGQSNPAAFAFLLC